MSKTFRAVERGFYDGMLVEPDATFVAHDEFAPNWAVEVEDHSPNALNSGKQETLPQSLAPALPSLKRADAPLPPFHPAFAEPTSDQVTDDALAADKVPGDETPVIKTADTVSSSDPAKAKGRPGANAIDTGTAPSDAEAKDAKDKSADESKAQSLI